MPFESFWCSEWPDWKKMVHARVIYDIRRFYRWGGMKVPQLSFEPDRTQADFIEAHY